VDATNPPNEKTPKNTTAPCCAPPTPPPPQRSNTRKLLRTTQPLRRQRGTHFGFDDCDIRGTNRTTRIHVLAEVRTRDRLARLCFGQANIGGINQAIAIHIARSAIGFGIVFGRLRRGYGAPWEKPIHLAGGTRCPQRVGKQVRLRRLTSEGGWVPRSFIRLHHESL
jgi:hypothetical protein